MGRLYLLHSSTLVKLGFIERNELRVVSFSQELEFKEEKRRLSLAALVVGEVQQLLTVSQDHFHKVES